MGTSGSCTATGVSVEVEAGVDVGAGPPQLITNRMTPNIPIDINRLIIKIRLVFAWRRIGGGHHAGSISRKRNREKGNA